MVDVSNVFERNYQAYCARIAEIDFKLIRNRLGGIENDDGLCIPFFNERYTVSKKGIVDASGRRPDYMISVILAKYILLCPDKSYNDSQWASFKDFKSTSHFTNVNYFSSDTERAIERHFSGKLKELKKACEALEGIHQETAISYDLSMRFDALPRISLLLLFNDEDEAFPATCIVLFQKHSEYYLDPESLAMTGALLAKFLERQANLYKAAVASPKSFE